MQFRNMANLVNFLAFYILQELARCEEDLSSFKAMREQGASPQLEADIKRLEKVTEILSQDRLCYEAQILRVCLRWIMNIFFNLCWHSFVILIIFFCYSNYCFIHCFFKSGNFSALLSISYTDQHVLVSKFTKWSPFPRLADKLFKMYTSWQKFMECLIVVCLIVHLTLSLTSLTGLFV